MPDLENMARAYLNHRDLGEDQKADFLVIEMIDQCVRTSPGGEMGQFFRAISSRRHPDPRRLELNQFVYERVGEIIEEHNVEQRRVGKPSLAGKLWAALNVLRHQILRTWLLPLPAAFKSQNLSLAEIGERHHWVWDFHQLKEALIEAGFVNVEKQTASTSSIEEFPIALLDLNPDGEPRKGKGSMYVEATKPAAM